MNEEVKNPSAGPQVSNFCSIVRHTYKERYEMYMELSKEQLAGMLAERDITYMPEACTECADERDINPTITISASSYNGEDLRMGDKITIDYQHDFYYEK
jgi:hypothetical protein